MTAAYPGLFAVELEPLVAQRAAVRARQHGDALEIEDGSIRANFRRSDGGITQDYFAREGQGTWRLMMSSLLPENPRPEGTSPLYSSQGRADALRILASSQFNRMELIHSGVNGPAIKLSGEGSGGKFSQCVCIRDGNFHIDVSAELAGSPPRIEYLLSTFTFEAGKPDFTHAPCLKRADDDVIADHIFDAPVALLQQGGLMAALLPDLDVLNNDAVYAKGARAADGERGFRIPQDADKLSLPALLDLDLKSGLTDCPVVTFGLGDYVVEPHVFWRHENKNGAMAREISSNKLRFAFELMLDTKATSLQGFRKPSVFLWRKYGSRFVAQPRPQVMPFAEYAKVCYPAAFAYTGDTLDDVTNFYLGRPYVESKPGKLPTWLEFESNGVAVGGIRATPPVWYDDIQFSVWWNNVRDAEGMFWWGQRLEDNSLIEKSRRMVRLALQAPQKDGIFPSIFRFSQKRWVGCYWKFPQGSDGNWSFPEKFDPTVTPKYWDMDSDYYMPPAASLTSVRLLRYRRLCEDHPQILPFVSRYAEFLMGQVSRDGQVPTWFDSSLHPVQHLAFNADGGAHIWFLCELYRVTRDQRLIETAKRIAGFMSERILPHQVWYDMEAFYSCSPKPENFFDTRTGQRAQCTLSMMWAIRGLTELARISAESRYLDAALAVAEYSQFYQACWQPHFITTAYAFGGFRAQNSDAEWLDARESGFAEALASLGVLAGRQDTCERAVAALRASFAAISHPRSVRNGVFPYPRYPLGIEPENIDHDGIEQTMLRSGFDWGEGGALAAAADVHRSLGGLHIDAKRNSRIGVDGITITRFEQRGKTLLVDYKNLLAELTDPWREPYQTELRIEGLEPGDYSLVVNGAHPVLVSDAALRSYPLMVR